MKSKLNVYKYHTQDCQVHYKLWSGKMNANAVIKLFQPAKGFKEL